MGKFPTHLALGPLQVIDCGQTYESAREMMEYLDQDVDTKTEVAMLTGDQRQLVAIARALSFDPDLIILDEPTSALSIAGTELVYENIRRLRDEGHTQVIVSHSIRTCSTLRTASQRYTRVNSPLQSIRTKLPKTLPST